MAIYMGTVHEAGVIGLPIGTVSALAYDIDETSTSIGKYGTFTTNNRGHLNTALQFGVGSYYTVQFTFTRFQLISAIAPEFGTGKVEISYDNGVSFAQIGTFSQTNPAGASATAVVLFTSALLPAGPKVLRVTNTSVDGKMVLLDLMRGCYGTEVPQFVNPDFTSGAIPSATAQATQRGWVATNFTVAGNGQAVVSATGTATLQQLLYLQSGAVYRFEVVVDEWPAGVVGNLPYENTLKITKPGLYSWVLIGGVNTSVPAVVSLSFSNAVGAKLSRFSCLKL